MDEKVDRITKQESLETVDGDLDAEDSTSSRRCSDARLLLITIISVLLLCSITLIYALNKGRAGASKPVAQITVVKSANVRGTKITDALIRNPLSGPVENVIIPTDYSHEGKLADAKFENVTDTCIKREFVRKNIGGTGFSCSFVTKSASFPSPLSENDGTCVTMYYWIYKHETTKEVYIHKVGPYYGSHVIQVNEQDFCGSSPSGSFNLFGCTRPFANNESFYDVKTREPYKTEGNIYITKGSSHYYSLDALFESLAEDRKKAIESNEHKLYDMTSINTTTMIDYEKDIVNSTNCIYSI